MEIRWIDDFQTLASSANAWNQLVERSQTHTIFQTFEWHQSWWKAFGGDAKPLVLLAHEDATLLGIAPLVMTRRWVLGRRRRVIEFMGSGASDYADFIVDTSRPDVLNLLVRWLAEHGDLWDLLLLSNIPDEHHVKILSQQCEHVGMDSQVRTLCRCLSCCCSDSEEGQAFLRHKRLRRARNYYSKHGELAIEVHSSAEVIAANLPAYFQQHILRRAVTEVPSKFLDERWQVLYRELGRALAPAGQMLLMETCLDGQPLAYEVCFRRGDSLLAYDRCFDIERSKHSPGQLSLANLIQYMLDHSMHRLDLGRGDEPYKLQIANREHKNLELRVYHSTLSRALDRLALRAVTWLEASPRIGRFGRRLMMGLQSHRWGPIG